MPTLNELAESYKNIAELLDDETIEPETLSIALKTIEGDIAVKSQNIAVILNSMEYDMHIIEAERNRLKKRLVSIEEKYKWLKNYLQLHLENLGLKKVKTPMFTISLQKNPQALKILDEKLIPIKYLTIVPQKEIPNKELIKEALKAGESIPGAELTQGSSLRVR